MKDTLLGLTTVIILFGIVWLSQFNSSDSKHIVKVATSTNNVDFSEQISDCNDEIEDCDDAKGNITVNSQSESIDACSLCNEETNMSDDFTFGEAFKFCRECSGDEGIFIWKYQVYNTKVKSKINNAKADNEKNIMVDEEESLDNSKIEVENIDLVDKVVTDSSPSSK